MPPSDSLPVPLHLVLIAPEIAPNTGNVARTCAVTGCALHLVGPLGFRITDAQLKRAGLDYWDSLTRYEWPDLTAYLAGTPGARRWLFSTIGGTRFDQVTYAPGDHLCFGSETSGLPRDLLAAHPAQVLRVPMRPNERSLNLSNVVALGAYHALAQLGYPGME